MTLRDRIAHVNAATVARRAAIAALAPRPLRFPPGSLRHDLDAAALVHRHTGRLGWQATTFDGDGEPRGHVEGAFATVVEWLAREYGADLTRAEEAGT